MDFRAQIYCEADGVPSPLDPKDVSADSYGSAAQQITGDSGLLESGHHGKLAVTVWLKGEHPPKRRSFYRP